MGQNDDVEDFTGAMQAVIDELTRPLDTSAPNAALKEAGAARKGIAYVSSGGEGADPVSIRFLKDRHVDGQYVVAVEWTNGEGTPKSGAFSLARQGDGLWRRAGSHSGGRDGGPTRGRPWVNVGAGGDPFYVGGVVVETDKAALVRLVFDDGLILEDEPDQFGIVLFPTGRPPDPMWPLRSARAEIYTADGALIARHALFGRSEPL